jgi:hypothetical protein
MLADCRCGFNAYSATLEYQTINVPRCSECKKQAIKETILVIFGCVGIVGGLLGAFLFSVNLMRMVGFLFGFSLCYTGLLEQGKVLLDVLDCVLPAGNLTRDAAHDELANAALQCRPGVSEIETRHLTVVLILANRLVLLCNVIDIINRPRIGIK